MTTSRAQQDIILLKNGNLWLGTKQLLHGSKMPLGVAVSNPVILTMSTKQLAEALMQAASAQQSTPPDKPKPPARFKGWDMAALEYVDDNWGEMSYNQAMDKVAEHFSIGKDAALEMLQAADDFRHARRGLRVESDLIEPDEYRLKY